MNQRKQNEVIVLECNPFCNSHGETEKVRELTVRVVE